MLTRRAMNCTGRSSFLRPTSSTAMAWCGGNLLARWTGRIRRLWIFWEGCSSSPRRHGDTEKSFATPRPVVLGFGLTYLPYLFSNFHSNLLAQSQLHIPQAQGVGD